MSRNTNVFDSPPPLYQTHATSTPSPAYGTIHSTPQPPSGQSRQTYTRRHDGGPTATETSSLWNGTAYPRRDSRRTSLILYGVLALLLTVVFAQNVGLCSTFGDDVSLSEKAAMRRNWRMEKRLWAAEKEQWATEKEQWGLEKVRHEDEAAMWGREREAHLKEHEAFERERAHWARQREDNREAFERERAGWARQRKEEQDAFEREREERQEEREAWGRQRQEEEEERGRQRKAEEEEWGRQRKAEEDAFEEEREEWKRQRVEEDVHRKEIEWRRRGAYWTEPWATGSQCSGYGTRSYSAHLLGLPADVNWLEACMDMPIKINGRWVNKPFRCQRDDHNTWGTWLVNFGESQCVTYWDTLRDMGCSPGQTGMRRYEARLMNLRNWMGDDWDLMCRTTPATIGGIHFDFPTSCEHKDGRTGIWDVPNGSC